MRISDGSSDVCSSDLKEPREEEPVFDADTAKACRHQAPSHLGRGNKHGMLVEGAIPHRMAGQRVPGVVLEEKQNTLGSKALAQLREQGYVDFSRNMVKNAGGEDEIERAEIRRNLYPVIDLEPSVDRKS